MKKECEGFRGYFVNTIGDVFYYNTPVDIKFNNGGYCVVAIRNDDGKIKRELVHRLVAKAFLGLPRGLVVDHLNGIKHDNRLDNLDVVTIKENNRRHHALKKAKKLQGILTGKYLARALDK